MVQKIKYLYFSKVKINRGRSAGQLHLNVEQQETAGPGATNCLKIITLQTLPNSPVALMRNFLYIFLFLSWWLMPPLYAGVQEITMDAGLPDKCINGICKDNRGLMWIGTQSGLCRYDGFSFLPLHHKNVINQVAISKMLYDPEHDFLWLATDKGLYRIACEKFMITFIGDDRKWTAGAVTDMLLHDDGHCFASYKSGQIIDVAADNSIRLLTTIPSENYLYSFPIHLRYNNHVLDIVSSRQHYFTRFRVPGNQLLPKGIDSLPVPDIAIDNDQVRFNTSQGRKTFALQGNTIERPAFAKSLDRIANIYAIHLISDQVALVVSRPCNIYRIDLKALTVTPLSSSDQLNGRVVKSTCLDADNILWIGTNKGLLKLIPEKPCFEKELIASPPVSIRSFAMDEAGTLYAGTYSGLFKKTKATNTWRKINGQIPFAMTGMPGKYLYFVEEQLNFSRINKLTGIPESGFYRTTGLEQNGSNSGYTIAAKNNRQLLIGTNSGLVCYDIESNTIAPYKIRNFKDKNIEIRYIRIYGDRMLLATNTGLYEVNEQAGTVMHYSTTTRPRLSSDIINFAEEDALGNIWLCTENGGINIIRKERDSVTRLGTAQGLSNNTTYNLVTDGGYAWISTYTGLSRYDVHNGKFYNFFARTDGLSDDECNRNAFLRDPAAGKVYFGTINGLNTFYPGNLTQQTRQSRLFAAAVSKWDNNEKSFVDVAPALFSKPVIMHALDHSLLINLALSDYSNPEKTVFSYRVKGLFDNWVNTNNTHVIQLNGLPPGTYTIEAKAIDSHGMPVTNMLKMQVKVLQPFYRSFWFYLFLCCIAFLVTAYIYTLRMRNIKKLNRIRQQLATDLHDEVGSLLTRITLSSDSLRLSRHNDQEKAARLAKISGLSRSAVSSMNDILWTIDARNNFSGSLADRIREHAEEIFLPLSVELIFDFRVLPKKNIPMEVRQQLYLIFKEAVHNIARHSKATRVTIGFRHEHARLSLNIMNNGCQSGDNNTSVEQAIRNINKRAAGIKAQSSIQVTGDIFKIEISLPG